MEIQIESIHEVWELKRALKARLEEKDQAIRNLREEKYAMKESGMSENVIDFAVRERILNVRRDKKTCIKLLKEVNVLLNERGVY